MSVGVHREQFVSVTKDRLYGIGADALGEEQARTGMPKVVESLADTGTCGGAMTT
jgi:hypothetical protein